MDSSERLVQTWMASGRDEEINEIVSDISNDRTSLINIVKALGEYLTSDDSELLGRGVELLALVVARLPSDKLNRQSVRVLTTFFTGKLDDTVTVKQALSGLVTLCSLSSFSSSEATAVLEGIFRHVQMKGLVQDVRFKVFSIIDFLMATHRSVMKSMGKPFLDGYISLAEGEKDPRNLMVAFAIARVILIEFDISAHVESMFNILFCYFPITFRPPPNDKYGISSEDLKTSLRRCLNASPAFGTLAVPVFLEKITAGSRATKKDTLQTLASCLPVYGSALGRAFSRKLWNSLKLEVFQPVDPQAEDAALKTIQVLIKTIYSDEEEALESDEDVQGLARDACEECLQILKEPEKTQARAATKILCAFMSTTPSVSRYTISQAVPHFIKLFQNPDEASTRLPTLVLLGEVINAARYSTTDNKGPTANTDSVVLPYKDETLGILTTALQTASLRSAALAGLEALCSTDHLLTSEELGFVVHKVNDVMELDPEEFDDNSDAILGVLTAVSERSPHHVTEQTLPMLFSSLPDTAPHRDAVSEREKCWNTLSILRRLCIQQALFENLVVRLTAKFDFLCFSSGEAIEDIEPTQAYAHMILKTLAQTLAAKVKAKHLDIAKYIDSLVPRLFNVFVASALLAEESQPVASDPRLIGVAGEIITLVVQSLPPSKQQPYSMGLSKAIVEGDVTEIAEGFRKFPNGQKFLIFTEPSKSPHRDVLALISAAVIPLHKDVRLSLREFGPFLDQLLRWALDTADTEMQKMAALHMVSQIINRRAEELSDFLNDKLDTFWKTNILSPIGPLDRRRWAIKSWIWISKSLLVRKHPQAMTFAERLYDGFDDDDIGWDVAKALGDIASPDEILTKANHADVKILYVQKYVNTVLPKLIASASDLSKSSVQTAALVALSSVIKASPKSTYAHEMPTLIPLLLRGLDLPDAGIRSNVIDTLLAAAEGESSESTIISEHSVTLVNLMLKNSKVQEMPSMKVRISALRYLAVLPSIVRYDVLHPTKPAVLRELANIVDDPKRTVRKEAVDARTNWFKYKG